MSSSDLPRESALRGAQRIGIVGEQVGVGGNDRDRAIEGARRIGMTIERVVGAREHHPPVDIVGLLLQPGREFRRHRLDLLWGDLVLGGAFRTLRGDRRERLVIAQHDIEQQAPRWGSRRR